MEFLFVVSRYYFSKGLIIMVVLFTVLAVGMYVYGRLQQKNAFRKSVIWLGCLAVSSMILLALLYICNIRNPKVFVGNVTITSDETVEGESGIDITFFLDTYDMRGLQLEVSAEVTREYKGENDVDYQSSVGSDNTSEGMMGRTKTLYLSDRDAQYHTIHIPYKALYHKKGLNSYSVAIMTYYIDGNKRTYLYNGDGYHAYSHTFKTSNVDKKKRASSVKNEDQPKTATKAATTKSKTTRALPHSMLGINYYDSTEKVRKVLAQKGIQYDEDKDEYGFLYFQCKDYSPELFGRTFDDMRIYFDDKGVMSFNLCYLESYSRYTHVWEEYYELLKKEIFCQYAGYYDSSLTETLVKSIEAYDVQAFRDKNTDDVILLMSHKIVEDDYLYPIDIDGYVELELRRWY